MYVNQKNIVFIPKEQFNKKTASPGYFWILAHPRRSWDGPVVPLGTGEPSKLFEASWYHARHVIPYIYCKTYGKLSLFIFLTLYQHLGSKGAKFCILWSISTDHLNEAECGRYELQNVWYSKCMASHVARDITMPRTVRRRMVRLCSWAPRMMWV